MIAILRTTIYVLCTDIFRKECVDILCRHTMYICMLYMYMYIYSIHPFPSLLQYCLLILLSHLSVPVLTLLPIARRHQLLVSLTPSESPPTLCYKTSMFRLTIATQTHQTVMIQATPLGQISRIIP